MLTSVVVGRRAPWLFPVCLCGCLHCFLVSCTRDLNFHGRCLGYVELVSQAFCAPLIRVAKVQTVLGRCWKEWKIFLSLILYSGISAPGKYAWFIYIFNSFSEIIVSISQIRQFLVSDHAYFIVTRASSFPRTACNSPAFERIFWKTKMTAKSVVFMASQQRSDIWLSFASLMFLPL